MYTYELLRITEGGIDMDTDMGTGTKHGKDMDIDLDRDIGHGHGHGHGHRQNYVSKITFSRGHSKQYSISSSMPKKDCLRIVSSFLAVFQ